MEDGYGERAWSESWRWVWSEILRGGYGVAYMEGEYIGGGK